MNEKLYRKLLSEEPLSAAEHLELEQSLEAGDQTQIAQYFGGQEFAEPSMAWRSDLNEKLREIAPEPVRDRRPLAKWLGFGGLIAMSAVACAFGVALVISQVQSKDSPVDGRLVAEDKTEQPTDLEHIGKSDGDLGTLLISSHNADATQVSVGIRSPRVAPQLANSRLDYSNW